MKGFTFPYGQKTVFIKTKRERKTKSLAKNILREMKLPINKADELLYWLQKCDCEINQLSNGSYYSITGNKFGEAGPIEKLIILNII